MKFDDFYVRKTTPLNEPKFMMENELPIGSRPVNIVEVDYETLFDPPKTTRLVEVLISPSAQLQHTKDSSPSVSEDYSNMTSTSLVEGGKAIPQFLQPSRFQSKMKKSQLSTTIFQGVMNIPNTQKKMLKR